LSPPDTDDKSRTETMLPHFDSLFIFILINIKTTELLTVSGIPTTLPCITTVKQTKLFPPSNYPNLVLSSSEPFCYIFNMTTNTEKESATAECKTYTTIQI
jgi:hypothetical protein